MDTSAKMGKNESDEEKIYCKYGVDCYQKNPQHREKYCHPSDQQSTTRKRSRPLEIEETTTDEDIDEEVDDHLLSPYSRKQREIAKKKHNVSQNSSDEDDVKNVKKAKDSINNTPNTVVKRQVFTKGVVNKSKSNLGKWIDTKPIKPKEKVVIVDESKSTSIIADDAEKLIKELFLFQMPKDFYDFYKFCQSLSSADPNAGLKPINLELVGPYDVLRGKIKAVKSTDKDKYLLHWRFYFDPPEFQTILKDNGKDGLHYGYWRDDPNEDPAFVAKNSASIDSKIIPVGPNVFVAVKVHVEEQMKTASVFDKPNMAKILQNLNAYAKKHSIYMEAETPEMISRKRQVVCKTFHGAGLVVPYNKNTQIGYRNLAMADSHLKQLLQKLKTTDIEEEKRSKLLSNFEETIRLANIAADECDFGTPLELAHDLFASDVDLFKNTTLNMFTLAYNLLGRVEFAKIAEQHLGNRKKGSDLSVI